MTDLVSVASDLPQFINTVVLCAEQARAKRLCLELTPKAFIASHDGLSFEDVTPERLPQACAIGGSELRLTLADVAAKQPHAAFAKALNGLRVEALLFLDTLRMIDISITYPNCDKNRRVSLSAKSSALPNGFGQRVTLCTTSKKDAAKTSAYLRFDEPRQSAAKNVGLALPIVSQDGALRFREATTEVRLFAPLPTEARTPFCFLLRGNYALSANGKALQKDAAVNKALAERTSALFQKAIRTINTLPLDWCDTKTRLSLVDILPGYAAPFEQLGKDVERLYRQEPLMPSADGALIALDQAWLLDPQENARCTAGLFREPLVKQLFDESKRFVLPYGLTRRAINRLHGYSMQTKRIADLAERIARRPTAICKPTDNWLNVFYTVFRDYLSPYSNIRPSLCGLPIFRSSKGFLQPAFRAVSGGCWMPQLCLPGKTEDTAASECQLDAALYNANRDFFDNVLHLPPAC